MDELTFTWDPHKETANRRRHNVAFREAQSAFYDENARIFADPDHSDDEDRFILLGLSNHPRVLVV